MESKRIGTRQVLLGLAAKVGVFRGRVALAVALLVAAKLAAVAVPLMLKRIVDALGHPETFVTLPVALLMAYALMRFASTLFTELRDLVVARAAQSTVADLTQRVFHHLHSLSPRFHMQRASGALTRDVERGTAGIAFLLGVAFFTIVPTIVEIGAVMAIMMSGYALQLTLVLLTTFVFYVVFTVAFTRQRSIHQRSLNELDSNAKHRLVDSLLHYETVKLYANEAFEARRFRDIMGRWIEAGVGNQKALTRLRLGQSAIVAAGVASVMLIAGRGALAGTMSVGDLVLINAYVIQLCLPLNSLGFVFREASDALVKAERLFELLGQKPEIEEAAGKPLIDVADAEVRFERVSFGYEPARQVLFDVDLAIAPGSTVAVVGGSGSGKSTLARLLLRFYDVQSGRVTVNGEDVRELSPRSLRQAIGVVPQDTSLFDDTIGYNIAYGRVGATQTEIIGAARAANVHDFIASLPEGYGTVVGEHGLKLSGGEKQRIAIARTILKNPPILIFDEATSALDTRSERAIQDELQRLSKSRTTLIIARRLSTVVDADEIVVLEHGRVVERGRHDALLARGGLYAQMWALQQQERELQSAERRAAMHPVNLVAIVAGAIDALRRELDARDIQLYTTIGMEAARVTGDPGLLQRLVWDLLAHAVQVSGSRARVEVRLERAHGDARLVVTDTQAPPLALAGATPAEDEEAHVLMTSHVFDPAELRKIAEEHQGRFTIRHAKPGTSYVVSLPLRALEAVPPRDGEQGAQTPLPSLEGCTVAVVDDHEDAREILAAVLESRGAHVRSFASGGDLLRHVRGARAEDRPDLLLCDIGLPDIDGHTVLREVRAFEAQRDTPLHGRVPAIALTGRAEPEDRTRALLAGFQLHLVKPVDPRKLLASVASLLSSTGKSRARRSNNG